MSRILLLLLVCFCSSLRAEYQWTGSEWQWKEPDRQPLAPVKQQQGSGGGATFDDDYDDDEDVGPYDKDDAGVDDDDDDEDDDYYGNYDQKGKKGGVKDKGLKLPASGSKGGKGNGGGQTLGPALTGGKGLPAQEKGGKSGKQDKDPKNKKSTALGDGQKKQDSSSGSKRGGSLPQQPLPQAPRGKGGSFIQTDDEDLMEGSGEDSDSYWEGGSGGGPFNTRVPSITETSPDIDLDVEEGKKVTGGGGGPGKAWNVDSSWSGATTTPRPRAQPAPTTQQPAKTVPGNDDQFDYDGEDDEDDNDDDDDYKNPVDDYDDDDLLVGNNDDDISIDEAVSSTARPPPAAATVMPSSPPAGSTTIRPIVTSSAPSVPAIALTTTAPSGAAEKSPPDTPIISDMLPNNRPVSFFAQPGILAAVIGGAVVGLLCAILLVMFIVYRMRKKDEGSYILDEPTKRTLGGNLYTKTHNKEFYA